MLALHDGTEIRAHSWDHERPEDFPQASLESDSLALQVIESGSTIVREGAVGVPIRSGQRILGAIAFAVESLPDAEVLTLLESCAMFAGARLSRDMLLKSTARYEELAYTDGLTDVANRRRFDELLAKEWKVAARARTPISLLMIDVDYFKAFNDNYGHQAGDLCLQQVGHALQSTLKRPADVCARYGGEEFVALLPGTDLNGAVTVGEQILSRITALGIPHAGSTLRCLSVSIGAASLFPAPLTEPDALVHAADTALYDAKGAGRNRVAAANYTAQTAPVLRSQAVPNNLPVQFTHLVGRRREVEALRELTAVHRLVTVTAIGGAGKTRVALQVAAELVDENPYGVWFVDLAPIVDGKLIASAIGGVFSAQLPGDERALPALINLLEKRTLLLVLDNCEHLAQPVGEVATALFAGCPGVRILATSRVALELPEEEVYRLPLLSLPSMSTASMDAATALTYDAVALFVERAKTANQNFTLTDDNASAIVEICRQVDGIALAIELAAARLSVIGVHQIAERLTRRLRILTGGDRTAPARRQTMRALIDWSYELLTPAEQLLLARLGVFAGGCTLEAAREVCFFDDLEAEDVPTLLRGLVRHSLLIEEMVEGNVRYRFLESIREYAGERLAQSGEADALAFRHASYFLSVARELAASRPKISEGEWYLSRRPELENFRAALRWSFSSPEHVVLGAELAPLLSSLFIRVSTEEGLNWVRRALDLLPAGEHPALEADLWRELAGAKELDPALQRTAGERSVALYRMLNDRPRLISALRYYAETLAWYYPACSDLADRLARESGELARESGAMLQASYALEARCSLNNWDVARKRAILEEGLVLSRAHSGERSISITFLRLADLEFKAGNVERAIQLGQESARYANACGDLVVIGGTESTLAVFAAVAGDLPTLRRSRENLLRLWRENGSPGCVTWSVEPVAIYAVDSGEYVQGARLLGFCASRTGTLHPPHQTHSSEAYAQRELLTRLQAELSEDELAAAMEAGAALEVDEALREAQALLV